MKNFIILSLYLICSLTISAQTFAATSSGQPLDKILVIVNDAAITQSDLNEALANTKKQIVASGNAVPSEDALSKQILQQMIDRKVQLQLAEQAGVKVDDAQLEKAINIIATQNKISKTELFNQLKTHDINIDDYRKTIREEIALQQIQQHEVAAKLVITPQEVDDFKRSKIWLASNNKEYRIEDILIALPDSPTSQQVQGAKKRAEDLLVKLHNGLNFHDTAFSESSGDKALQGGDLGWRKLPEIPPAFAEQILEMNVKDIAGPIQTANGFHLIHIAAIREGDAQSKPNNKQIEQLIFQRKLEEALPIWISKIRSAAYINMHPES